jgi:hypothetical protein
MRILVDIEKLTGGADMGVVETAATAVH